MRTLTIAAPDGERLPGRLVAGSGDVGIVLAHGAGAGQDHPWMVTIRDGLVAAGLTVLTFDYPYMAAGRKAPDRAERLLNAHAAAVARLRKECDTIALAGKSMGARIGSHLAGDRGEPVAGLVHYGYPLVAIGRTEARDVDHLARITVPQLFFVGTRDRLCPVDLIRSVVDALAGAELIVIDDADHSFNVPKASATTTAEVLVGLATGTAAWLTRV
ncbi:MAG: dienelactone hydrolase family protein [Actinomycetota bacterium]|nr:dienelactone hydrolase family protein [Actinomycetota bacterium]